MCLIETFHEWHLIIDAVFTTPLVFQPPKYPPPYMPVRAKSGPGQCCKCDRLYSDLLEHITKRHQTDRFNQHEVEEYGLVACVCGRVVRNSNGLAKHHARFGCLSAQGTPQRVLLQRSVGMSTLTSLPSEALQSRYSQHQQPSIHSAAFSSALTSLTPSVASRQTVRPVNLDGNPLMPLSSRSSTAVASSISMGCEEEEELEVVEEVEDEEMLENTWVDTWSEGGGADGLSTYSLAVSHPSAYQY